jgi:hypothetical protein
MKMFGSDLALERDQGNIRSTSWISSNRTEEMKMATKKKAKKKTAKKKKTSKKKK